MGPPASQSSGGGVLQQTLSILLLLLHIGLDCCNSDMNAVFGCYKTQRYTAKYPAVLHSGFGNAAIGSVLV